MRNVPTVAVVGVALACGVTLLSAPAADAEPTADAAKGDPVAAEATVLSVTASRRLVGPTDEFEVAAELTVAADASPVVGQSVLLQWRPQGKPGWRAGPDAVTDDVGAATWQVGRLDQSRRYRVVFDGTAIYAPSGSPAVTVQLRPGLVVAASRTWVRPTGAVTVRARMRPVFDRQRVTLQRRDGGTWRDVRSKRQDAEGRARFSVPGRSAYGPDRYRVVAARTSDHVASHSQIVQIRTVRVVTYVIATRGKVASAMPSFRRRTAQIYADPRGWLRANVHFRRVKRGGDFSLVLSQARYLPSFDPTCDRYWSCRSGRYVVINEDRWREGTPYFIRSGGTLRQYRAMVVNHETGHWFGLGHATCGGAGRPAPVMMQQSKGLHGCEPNPWPLAWEISRAY